MFLMASYIPLTVLLLTVGWLFVAVRFFRPVARYLEADDTAKIELAPPAFRTAQALPYLLAASKVVFWIVGGLLLLLQAIRFFGMDAEHASLVLAAAMIIALAAVLYEALWHRRTLRPLLALLTNRYRLPAGQIRSPVSLRVKMVSGFGVLTVFSCAAAVFWSYVQYRNLATDFIQKEARLGADLVLDKLRTQVKLQRDLTAQDIAGLLRELARGRKAVCYHLPPAGRTFATGGKAGDPPSLPFRARTRMRRQDRGLLTLSELKLTGAFVRIRLSGKDYGSVAVLYPDYRGRGPGVARHIKVLLVFFTALLLLSAGIVVLIVADLTGPLKVLEQRVDEMARGDLHRPVPGGGEADEVGRLTFAFEGLRRSLDEKLRTIQELNLGLEKKVKARTADLAKANEELRQALDTLTRTQDQLVRSEKLASIGQLVAGVAHELNNPINAVFNSVQPMESSLDDLLSSADPAARDTKRAAETAEEIRKILTVIKSGAHRTQKIVSALSSYSRADEERPVSTDINAAVDAALQITAHVTAPFTVERDFHPEIRVQGRPGQLEQVFVNLIANAAQALSDRDGGWIRIRTRKNDGGVTVHVADNGPGIPEEALQKIFDPFFTTKEVGQGTGLGLSICHEIVSRHGGSIEVESQAGQGATFMVSLPTGDPEDA
jgi:signal transduction histidine kinase